MKTTPTHNAQPPAAAKRSALAIASLWLGIIGLLLPFLIMGASVCLVWKLGWYSRLDPGALICWGVGLVAGGAVFCGHVASARIRKAHGLLVGRSLARAGLAIGYGCLIVYLVVPDLVPDLFPPRESVVPACAATLKAIQGAKETWALEHKKRDADTPTVQDLTGGKYIREMPRCPGGGTYSINPVGLKPTCSVPGHTY